MMAILSDLFNAAAPRTQQRTGPSRAQIELGSRAYAFFIAQGLQPHQAAALAGNFAHESGGRFDAVNPGDNPRGSPHAPHSMGIAQWNGDRARALVDYARSRGIDIPHGDMRDPAYVRDVIRRIPLERQLEFAWSEMQGSEGGAFRGIQGGTDLRTANRAAIGYHRPAGWTPDNPEGGLAFNERLTLANHFLNNPPNAGPTLPPPPPLPDPMGDASRSAGDLFGGRVTLNSPPPPTVLTPPTVDPPTTPPPDAPPPNPFGGLLAGLFGGTPPPPNTQTPPPGNDQTLNPSEQARRRVDSMLNAPDEGSGIRPIQLQPLDLTRLRALMQNRGMLGTA